MKVISIDTSGKFCSVSIYLSNNIKDSIKSKIPLSHSSELAVNVKEMIDKNNILIKDLDFITVNIGPGSFTGLRIGISFAKGLCLSNGIPLVPVNSFNIIHKKVNSREDSFYYGIYSHKDYIYGKKYDNKKENEPKLFNLTNNFNVPMYIYGLDRIDQYNNNIIDVDFDSTDLIDISLEKFENKKNSNLNLINPIYIDYNDII